MNESVISIIVPIYNTAVYLRDCLESIINQTYKKLEIILVDDGSTDCSSDIYKEFAEKDKRIKIIRKDHGGVSSARNVGLAAATGDLVAFVDSDDIISTTFVECLLSSGADIAQCEYTDDRAKLETNKNCLFENIGSLEMSEKLCSEGSISNTVVWGKLWKRQLFENVRFPEDRIHEDEFVTWKLTWGASSIARTSVRLYYYRKRPFSITSSMFSTAHLDILDALHERIEFYEKYGSAKIVDLSKAMLCFTIRNMWNDVIELMPENKEHLAREMMRLYWDVMHSRELGFRKKATVTLQILSPTIYDLIKKLSVRFSF